MTPNGVLFSSDGGLTPHDSTCTCISRTPSPACVTARARRWPSTRSSSAASAIVVIAGILILRPAIRAPLPEHGQLGQQLPELAGPHCDRCFRVGRRLWARADPDPPSSHVRSARSRISASEGLRAPGALHLSWPTEGTFPLGSSLARGSTGRLVASLLCSSHNAAPITKRGITCPHVRGHVGSRGQWQPLPRRSRSPHSEQVRGRRHPILPLHASGSLSSSLRRTCRQAPLPI